MGRLLDSPQGTVDEASGTMELAVGWRGHAP